MRWILAILNVVDGTMDDYRVDPLLNYGNNNVVAFDVAHGNNDEAILNVVHDNIEVAAGQPPLPNYGNDNVIAFDVANGINDIDNAQPNINEPIVDIVEV